MTELRKILQVSQMLALAFSGVYELFRTLDAA